MNNFILGFLAGSATVTLFGLWISSRPETYDVQGTPPEDEHLGEWVPYLPEFGGTDGD
jgi:hypothetical protein